MPAPIPPAPEPRSHKAWRVALLVLAFVALMLVGFVGGVLADRVIAKPLDLPPLTDSQPQMNRLIDEAVALVRAQALKPSSDTSMTAGALDGLLKSLGDRYAAYFDPKAYHAFQEETAGQFFGIGVNISVKDGHAMILAPIKGTPADKAGIKAGDEIVSIDGVVKTPWTSEDVVSRVRGPAGTKVTLKIKRAGAKDLLTFTITRAKIETPNVMSEMVGSDVGYMRLLTFNQQAADEVGGAVKELDAKGAKGYVLDLRENPGGLLTVGVDVASVFIKSGVVVRVDERDKPEEVQYTSGGYLTGKPLVVLVNQDSASAAEILAGALQDYGRATLVGEKTFGKGSVQTVRTLSNGGALKFTIAHYLTPKRRAIDGVGLVPDLVVKMDPSKQVDHKTDTQFQAAVARVRSMFP